MNSLSRLRHGLVNYIESSIRNKIIIPYAMLILLLAVTGTFAVTILLNNYFNERLRNDIINTGTVVNDELINRENLRRTTVRYIIATIGVPTAIAEQDWETLESIVNPIMRNDSQSDNLLILDPTGNEVLQIWRPKQSAEGGPTQQIFSQVDGGRDFSGLDLFRTGRFNQLNDENLVEIINDQNDDGLIIYTVAPMRDDDDAIIAYILLGNYLEEELDHIKKSTNSDLLVLFDTSAQIIDTTPELNATDYVKLGNTFTEARYQEVLNNLDQTLLDSFEQVVGSETIAFRLGYTSFEFHTQRFGILAVGVDLTEVNGTNSYTQVAFSLGFFTAVVLVAGIGFAVSSRIIAPILQLVQVTKDIAKGNLSLRSDVTTNDEVGVLAANFNVMTSELEQKTIELVEEASKLNAILSSIADGVIVQGMDGEVVIQNQAAQDILQTIKRDTAPDDAEFDALPGLLENIADLEYLEQRRLELGEHVLSALSASVKKPNGEQLGSVVILRDITPEVIAERLKDKFIRSVSHELKTPLFPLTGSISLVKMILPMVQAQTPEKMYEKLWHNIGVADEQSNDLKNVVMAMVDLSEIDGNQFAVNLSPLNLLDMLDFAVNDWYGQMEEKSLAFEVNLPDEPVWVNGDEGRLGQVVKILLKNAQYYTFDGSVQLTLRQVGETAELIVEDTGVGILEKDQAQLFTRFYRAIHEKRTFELSGIGLGLYLSRVIVERHGGEIGMDSKAFVGSRFFFHLPIIDPNDFTSDDDEDDDDWDPWGDEPPALLM